MQREECEMCRYESERSVEWLQFAGLRTECSVMAQSSCTPMET